MPTNDSIEQEIQSKGLTAPRVTQADLEAEIASEHYFTAEDGAAMVIPPHENGNPGLPPQLSLLTFCVLVLKNGFTVTGESACVSPENFNRQLGQRIARLNAVQKVWPLLGFRLRDQLCGPPSAKAHLGGVRDAAGA